MRKPKIEIIEQIGSGEIPNFCERIKPSQRAIWSIIGQIFEDTETVCPRDDLISFLPHLRYYYGISNPEILDLKVKEMDALGYIRVLRCRRGDSEFVGYQPTQKPLPPRTPFPDHDVQRIEDREYRRRQHNLNRCVERWEAKHLREYI